jgi:hypothetical protein
MLRGRAQALRRRLAGQRREQVIDAPPPSTTDVTVTFRWCLEQGVSSRPQYLWGTLLAARIAHGLGLERISVIEFGVAGGNGLLALERAADAASRLVGLEIEVYGFDIGSGFPTSDDYRDLPQLIVPGWFAMDEPALRARLKCAELVLGPVADTVPEFIRRGHAPVGFIAFDLDTYTGTMSAFALLDQAPERLLPRITCYFDDLFGYAWNDFNGERAAIADFNRAHERRKFGKIHGLRYSLPPSEQPLPWHEQMYIAHLFDHPEYSAPEGPLADGWQEAHRLAPDS